MAEDIITPQGVNLTNLTKPFPEAAHKSREGRGKRRFTYVEGHTVIHRLNDATANQWDLQILNLTSRTVQTAKGEDAEELRAHVRLTIPGLGSREHIGVQVVDKFGGEDLYKGCVTDALKKAATLFGVGLELYGADYEDEGSQPAQRPNPARPPAPRPQTPAPAPKTAQTAPRPPQSGETKTWDKDSFLAWLTANNISPGDVYKALGKDSTSAWLKAVEGRTWTDLKNVVHKAIFGALPELEEVPA